MCNKTATVYLQGARLILEACLKGKVQGCRKAPSQRIIDRVGGFDPVIFLPDAIEDIGQCEREPRLSRPRLFMSGKYLPISCADRYRSIGALALAAPSEAQG